MMRGISNIISALFVVSVILISTYTLTTAYIEHSKKISNATKKAIERESYAIGVSYGDAECNTESQRITLEYTGDNPEYFVRFICYDERNALESLCILPFIPDGALSAQYMSQDFPDEIELNMAACSELDDACITEEISCVALGAHTIREIKVFES